MLGCVDHKLEDDFLPLNGLTIYIFSVALLATFNWFGSPEILIRAEINASGFLVNSIAVASARNSLFLEIASYINCPNIGAKIRKINPINIKIGFPFSSSSLLLGPPQKVILVNQSESITTNPTITETTAERRIS